VQTPNDYGYAMPGNPPAGEVIAKQRFFDTAGRVVREFGPKVSAL
jgi:hypothetical protein